MITAMDIMPGNYFRHIKNRNSVYGAKVINEESIIKVLFAEIEGVVVDIQLGASKYKGSSYGNYEAVLNKTIILYSELYPIELNPEILINNCGFIASHDGFSNGSIILEKEYPGYALFASEWTIGETFKYLHELQNICWSLYKYELEIKGLK